MESSLLHLCIFQTALKNTFFPWYYFHTLESAGKDMVSLGGYSESLARRLVDKITIFDEKIVVELKSGLQMEVEG